MIGEVVPICLIQIIPRTLGLLEIVIPEEIINPILFWDNELGILMAAINANITIDLPDGIDFKQYINLLKQQLSNLTGLNTTITVREIDDPLSISPVKVGKIKE